MTWLDRFAGRSDAHPDPYMFDCHMLPQTAWVHGWDPKKNVVTPEVKSCGHVLRFGRRGEGTEELGQKFDALMERRGYPYRLADSSLWSKERNKKGVRHFRSQASNTACTKLAAADLRPETKARIREVYADDFRLLGFGEEDASEGLAAT
mmetsp:Transcript_9914/g.30735  ORF Transcript_9914/g.30735 Transcript_9914/m.30735 type:complete len:150 (+) Transcript_9914:662-1111(+)